MNPIFLDFEASSLHRGSFPIEIGWVSGSGEKESHLIRPAPEWLLPTPTSNWSPASERIHGIPLSTLMGEGEDHRVVAARVAEVFDRPDVVLYADSPFDAEWLNCLMRATEGPRPFAVSPVHEAFARACRPLLRLLPPIGSSEREDGEARIRTLAASIIARCEEAEERATGIRHRALADAERLWRTWRTISVEAQRASSGTPG